MRYGPPRSTRVPFPHETCTWPGASGAYWLLQAGLCELTAGTSYQIADQCEAPNWEIFVCPADSLSADHDLPLTAAAVPPKVRLGRSTRSRVRARRVWNRRGSLVDPRPDEGPGTEPVAATRLVRREPGLIPRHKKDSNPNYLRGARPKARRAAPW